MYLPKLEPKGWRVARSAQDAVSRSHSFPIKPLSLSADFVEEFLKSFIQQLTAKCYSPTSRSTTEAHGETMPWALWGFFPKQNKTKKADSVVFCSVNNFYLLQGQIRNGGSRCLLVHGSALTVSTQWLLCCCCSSVCMSLHLLPVLLLTISASKPQDINPFTGV